MIRLKELEAVIREQKRVIENLTVLTSVSGKKNNIDECQVNLTGFNHRLDLHETQLELLHTGNPDST